MSISFTNYVHLKVSSSLEYDEIVDAEVEVQYLLDTFPKVGKVGITLQTTRVQINTIVPSE
jgi:hypothetical protein